MGTATSKSPTGENSPSGSQIQVFGNLPPIDKEPDLQEQLRRMQLHASGTLHAAIHQAFHEDTDINNQLQRLTMQLYPTVYFETPTSLYQRIKDDVSELNKIREALRPIATSLGMPAYTPTTPSTGTSAAVRTLVLRAGTAGSDPNVKLLEELNSQLYPNESFPDRFALMARIREDVEMAQKLEVALRAGANGAVASASNGSEAMDRLLARVKDLESSNGALLKENNDLKGGG